MQYRRVLIKLSGELLGSAGDALDIVWINRVVQEICQAAEEGVQIAIVVGGGKLLRGTKVIRAGYQPYIGRLSRHACNGYERGGFNDVFEQHQMKVELMSAIPMQGHHENFNLKKAISALELGKIMILQEEREIL